MFFLSAAAGVGLYRLSPSLLDIGRIFRLAADKIHVQSADNTSAEPVLRGTIFDRDFKELAVSYRLFSLYVRPAEITNLKDVVQVIADVTGQEEEYLHGRLSEAKSIINVAEHLEQTQVDMIKNTGLSGIYIKAVEERFYPQHETAASLVGFTGEGVGLSGTEGVFDVLLQEGDFLTGSIPGIDFSDEKVLGRAKVDVIMTVDLEMQERVEQQLTDYLSRSKASRGIALVMDPKNGSVMAWASQPSYNPNYYWRRGDTKRKSLFEEKLDPDLLRRLKVRVAALLKNGDGGDPLLPETVAVSNYGINSGEFDQFDQISWQMGEENCYLPVCRQPVISGESFEERRNREIVRPVQLASLAASLVNGGWKVSPFVLGGIYDSGRARVYKQSHDTKNRARVFSPSMGIRIRRELAVSSDIAKKNMIMEVDSVDHMRSQGRVGEYVMQDALFAAIPEKIPEMLLLVVTQRDDLNPYPKGIASSGKTLKDFGGKLLSSLYAEERKQGSTSELLASKVPIMQDTSNYNQFLISSRIEYQERSGRGTGRVAVMPQLVGLSLRKGLQRINEYKLQVKIQGSGQIVSQEPGPGEPLHGVGECVLTLASEI